MYDIQIVDSDVILSSLKKFIFSPPHLTTTILFHQINYSNNYTTHTMQAFKRLDMSQIIFFQCDIQTFFKDYTYGIDGVINTAQMMALASNIFEAPLIETEQNPKIFGMTFPEIKEH